MRFVTRPALCGLALTMLGLGGCDDGGGGDATDVGGLGGEGGEGGMGGGGGEGGMGGMGGEGGMGGGGGEPRVFVRFAGRFGDQPASCGAALAGVGLTDATVRLLDFRFYLHDLALVTATGEAVPLVLDDDGQWQGGGVALIDFEDGSDRCAETGNAGTRDHVVGVAPAGEYTGIRFTLGVPADKNHAEATTAAPPLDVGSMFWVWQSGYKFLRLDLANDNPAPGDKWFVHLGSGGCMGEVPVAPPSGPCLRPNRATVTLDGFDAGRDVIVVDAAALLAGADVTVNTPDTPPGCMSSPVDTGECPSIFERLGLGWETGACVGDCAGQAFFRVEEAP